MSHWPVHYPDTLFLFHFISKRTFIIIHHAAHSTPNVCSSRILKINDYNISLVLLKTSMFWIIIGPSPCSRQFKNINHSQSMRFLCEGIYHLSLIDAFCDEFCVLFHCHPCLTATCLLFLQILYALLYFRLIGNHTPLRSFRYFVVRSYATCPNVINRRYSSVRSRYWVVTWYLCPPSYDWSSVIYFLQSHYHLHIHRVSKHISVLRSCSLLIFSVDAHYQTGAHHSNYTAICHFLLTPFLNTHTKVPTLWPTAALQDIL